MIIVTGHKGFVGRYLVRALQQQGEEVCGFDLIDGQDIRRDRLPKGADRVYHLAALTDAQQPYPWTDADTNIMGTLRVLEWYGDRVVFASSSMINYPVTAYAISKLAGEYYCRLYGAGIIRLCNLFGEGGHSVVDRFRQDEVLTIRGDGTQRRTYAPVENAVASLLATKPGSLGILTGIDMTVLEVAARHPRKPREFVEASPRDIIDGVQLLHPA